MVESSLKLCAGRTADGAVPFLGFLYEGPTERARFECDSQICRPGIKQVNICRGVGEDTADLERCGSVIGRFVVCKFLCLLEDSPDSCRRGWLGRG